MKLGLGLGFQRGQKVDFIDIEAVGELTGQEEITLPDIEETGPLAGDESITIPPDIG